MRRRVLRTVFIFVWLFVLIDIVFYVSDRFIGFEKMDPVIYPLVRILLPFLINLGAWIGSKQVILSEKFTSHLKNLTVRSDGI